MKIWAFGRFVLHKSTPPSKKITLLSKGYIGKGIESTNRPYILFKFVHINQNLYI